MTDTQEPSAATATEEVTIEPGIMCANCGGVDSHVSHTIRSIQEIQRRRICMECGTVQYTVEKLRPPVGSNGMKPPARNGKHKETL